MEKETVTFNDMPSVVTEIRDDVKGIKEQLQILLKKMESSHTDSPERVSMSVEDLAKYLCMPAKTVYDKLKKGDIPAYKPGKHWVAYKDEVDDWLETTRKNPAVESDEEIVERLDNLRNTHTSKEETTVESNPQPQPAVPFFDGKKVPPTLKEIQAYIVANHLATEADKFYAYYCERNWMTSGNAPVQNWISLLNAWDKRK